MSNDRPFINHEGRPQDHSGARAAAVNAWGRPEAGSHVGQSSEAHLGRAGNTNHVGTPAESHVGRPAPGNADHVGTPAFDGDARANAAIQQGLQNCGDIYRSSFGQVGSPGPDGGTGGAGQRFPDGSARAFGAGSDSSRYAEPVSTTDHAGEKPGILARLFKTPDAKGTPT